MVHEDLQEIHEYCIRGTIILQSASSVSVWSIEECIWTQRKNELNVYPTGSLSSVSLETEKCMEEKELQPHLASSVPSASHCYESDLRFYEDNDSNGSDVEDSACSPAPPRNNTSYSDESEFSCDYAVRTFLAQWTAKFNILHAALSEHSWTG